MTPEVRSLLALFDAGEEHGLAWYHRGRREVRRLAREYGTTEHRAAAVVAALSPRVRWAQNVQYAETVLGFWASGIRIAKPQVPVFGLNRDKAWRVLLGEQPLRVLSGPKVTAFYRNLTGDYRHVTVDVWAARAVGRDYPRSPAEYAAIAQHYVEAARLRDVWPAQMQSRVWVELRSRPYTRQRTGAVIVYPGGGD